MVSSLLYKLSFTTTFHTEKKHTPHLLRFQLGSFVPRVPQVKGDGYIISFLKGTPLIDPITVTISCLIANTEPSVIFLSFLWLKQSAKSNNRTRKQIVRLESLSFHLTFVLLFPLKVYDLKVTARLNMVLFEQLICHKHTPLGVISQVTRILTHQQEVFNHCGTSSLN